MQKCYRNEFVIFNFLQYFYQEKLKINHDIYPFIPVHLTYFLFIMLTGTTI